MAKRSGKRLRVSIAMAFLTVVLVLAWIAFVSPSESKYLNDPTLIATKPPQMPTFPPNAGSSMRQRFYKFYYEVFPPKRLTYKFDGSPAPVICSIHGLLNQCHAVTGVQFFIDKQVAAGSVNFGPTNTLNGPQWVTAFTNAVQTGEVQFWDSNKKSFRRENPIFIAVGKNAYLVLPKDRLDQYRKAK